MAGAPNQPRRRRRRTRYFTLRGNANANDASMPHHITSPPGGRSGHPSESMVGERGRPRGSVEEITVPAACETL